MSSPCSHRAEDPLSPPRGITRYEYGRARGWLARVYWTQARLLGVNTADRAGDKEPRIARKLFSDGVYGGAVRALEAAIAWQRAQREEAAAEPRERQRVPGYGYVRETTRSYRTAAGDVRSYPAFEVWFWDAAGRPCSTSYGIATHGAEGARARCEAWLERARAELQDRAALNDGRSEPLAQAG